MKKPLFLWMIVAIVAMTLIGCEKKKLPVPEEIEIPASSKEVFSVGISFDSGITDINTGTDPEDDTWDGSVPESDEEPEQEEAPRVKEVRFTAPSPWTATITDDTKAVDWLTVEPMSGAAGEVKLTVTAQANDTYVERRAAVTIKAGGSEATFDVVQAPKPIPVSSVTLDNSELSLAEGATWTLTAKVKPDDAADKTVTWATSNKAVATVDAAGKVTAWRAGKATIRAKSGKKSAYCKLSVTASATGISLSESTLELTEGETATLTAKVEPANSTDPVTWSSSDPSVATVDDTGKVTAVKAGVAEITAKAGDMSATCAVTVKAKVIAVTSVSLDKTTLDLTEGDTETLTATVSPDNATDKTVSWSSSDASVATVDQAGKVAAVKAGTATITAKAGDKSATCAVTVKAKVVAVTSVSLDKTTLDLTEGDTETLTATVDPDNATDKTVSWSTSDSSVATVGDTGKVTAVKAGTATITAKAGDKSATCAVTVKAKVIAVTSVSLDKTTLDLTEGDTETLTATVGPDNATDKTVTWSSSDNSVATVDDNGKVTAVKAGTATITAKAGDKSATCAVTVKAKVIAVTSVTLDVTSCTLQVGESKTLTATVNPSDATDKTVSWSSSDASVATVDQAGKVTAVKTGSATITAKAGDKTASCTVKVPVQAGANEGIGYEDL